VSKPQDLEQSFVHENSRPEGPHPVKAQELGSRNCEGYTLTLPEIGTLQVCHKSATRVICALVDELRVFRAEKARIAKLRGGGCSICQRPFRFTEEEDAGVCCVCVLAVKRAKTEIELAHTEVTATEQACWKCCSRNAWGDGEHDPGCAHGEALAKIAALKADDLAFEAASVLMVRRVLDAAARSGKKR